MRLIVLIILASLFGYGALQIDKIDPDNYVKMYLGNYVVEVKVLGFLLLLLLVVIVLYFLVWLVRAVWRSPKSLSRWQHRRNRNKADDQFGAGYLSLIKGDWHRAEKQLTTKSSHSHIPYVSYLAAAHAAQEQGKFQQRDSYLSDAYDAAPSERLAIGLTKAKLHEKAGQIEQAMATLHDVSELGGKNPQYTAMLIQIYQRSGNWSGIQELLPTAKKQKALPDNMLMELQNDVHFNSLLKAKDKAGAWKSLPRDQRKRIENIQVYAPSLVDAGDITAAEKLIRTTLSTAWSDELVDLYGQLSSDKPAKLLRRVEGWLMARPENAHLNLAAGRLARASNSMDSAKQYLQKAITLGKLPAAYAVLGEVFEADNQAAKALQMYRIGMQQLVDDEHQLSQIATSNDAALPSTGAAKQELVANEDFPAPEPV